MNQSRLLLILGLVLMLSGCFPRTDSEKRPKNSPEAVTPTPTPLKAVLKGSVKGVTESPKDKSLTAITKLFEQADAIHREAWWVLTSERRPATKSPFGKVQRALLSSQNIKLSNKSIFRCDRYIVKRDVMGVSGYPQKAEIFEKCSEKTEAKKIAQFFAQGPLEVQASFFPENLEEILGLGATVLNRTIQCTLKGNEGNSLVSLQCKDWAQDRTKEQMIRLDVYDYQQAGKNLIKLRGKVYENLTDIRKIEADVPLDGKIFVTETELYPPEPTPTPSPVKTPAPKTAATPERVRGAPPLQLPVEGEQHAQDLQVPYKAPPGVTPITIGEDGMLVPPPRDAAPVVDPDVLMMQQNQQQHGEGGGAIQMIPPTPVEEEQQVPGADQGFPEDGSAPVPTPYAEPPAAGGVNGR